MSKILKPQAPTPVYIPPPPSPTSTDGAVAQATLDAQNAAAEVARKQKGRAATILTGAGGDTSQATVSRRTLLGV